MDNIAPVAAVSVAKSQVTIESLQAQLERYSNLANDLKTRAGADYRALAAAISSGNLSAAETALARLQWDNNIAAPTGLPSVPDASAENSGNNSAAPSQSDALDTIA